MSHHDHESGIDQPSAILRRRCPFGLMMTVFVGTAYSVPLHPEHQSALARVASTGTPEMIEVETGEHWNASREDEDVVLRSLERRTALAIPVEEVVADV